MNSLFSKTVSIAIATTTLLVSAPSFAETKSPANHTTPVTTTHTVGTIVEVASANSSLKTLVTAIKAAGLVETLSGKEPLTVFAPTDAAFKALPKGTLAKLLKPENQDTLVKILTYHVVPGAITSKDIKAGEVKTVEGAVVKVQVRKGRVTVNNARVTRADVKASNGVIHVINKVLLPPDVKL
ncbi:MULTISPECIES: fasciclin domain-containing protein [Nostocales]|uniref:Fasciclin domain protein n=2 Tax=Dolichospermum TaxID=748770 RepID=A0A480ADI3_9CYAN|nr:MULTISPECIES: fasciclin domain-containing protein [Nostocales]MBD2269183.1 fasciclin domain-containing protein [Anabaena sp. FACHB-1391]MBE9220233.1 fasciclin domain-containing protein [Dolichospermum flos-aquae LEGE 04289]GCL42859.1 fasciclin domain protein [Dolichospermum planctonicum]